MNTKTQDQASEEIKAAGGADAYVVNSVNKLNEQYKALENEMNDCIRDLSQQMTGYKAGGHAGMETTETRTHEQAIVSEIAGKAEQIKSMGSRASVVFETPGELLVKNMKGAGTAATVTTVGVPRNEFAGAGMPAGTWQFGLHHAFSVIGTGTTLDSTLNYLRYSQASGNGAATEAPEASQKAQYDVVWNGISIDPWTIAGFAKISNQAYTQMPLAMQAIRDTGTVQIYKDLDRILFNGSASGNNKFEGMTKLAKTFTSAKYVNLPDAIEEAQESFLNVGLRADVVVLNYKTYLAVKTLQSSIQTYLAGDYLNGSFSDTIRGLRIVISPQIPDGKALVMDSLNHQLGISQSVLTEVGYVNDDFTKNLMTIRTEAKFIAQVFRDDAAYMVAAKAA